MAMPPAQRFCRPCPLITLNLDQLVSCCYLFYVKDYRLKLSNDVCKVALSGMLENVIVKLFFGGKPPDLLCYLSGTIRSMGNIIANVEGVVLKVFLIGAPSSFLSLYVQ